MMAQPENRVTVIKSLSKEMVSGVRLLGRGDVEWSQNFGVLTVRLPDKMPTEYVNCLAIKLG